MLTYLLGRGLVQDHLRVAFATIVPLAMRGPTPEPQGQQGTIEDVRMGDTEAGQQIAATAAAPASEVAETVEEMEIEVKQEPETPNQRPVAAPEPAEEDELEEGEIRE